MGIFAKTPKRSQFAAMGIFFRTCRDTFRAVIGSQLGWRAMPILVVLIALAFLLAVFSTAPAIAPFVYTLF